MENEAVSVSFLSWSINNWIVPRRETWAPRGCLKIDPSNNNFQKKRNLFLHRLLGLTFRGPEPGIKAVRAEPIIS